MAPPGWNLGSTTGTHVAPAPASGGRRARGSPRHRPARTQYWGLDLNDVQACMPRRWHWRKPRAVRAQSTSQGRRSVGATQSTHCTAPRQATFWLTDLHVEDEAQAGIQVQLLKGGVPQVTPVQLLQQPASPTMLSVRVEGGRQWRGTRRNQHTHWFSGRSSGSSPCRGGAGPPRAR